MGRGVKADEVLVQFSTAREVAEADASTSLSEATVVGLFGNAC